MMGNKGSSLLVLSWHNVEGTWCFPSTTLTGARGLERQLRTLHSVANVVPLCWALQTMSSGYSLPARAVSITFDDGYRDSLMLAGPLLRKLGLPATCFLVPGFLSGDIVPWWERLAWALAKARTDRIEWDQQRLTLYTAADRYAAFRKVATQLKSHDRRHREFALDELVTVLAPSGEYSAKEQFLDWDGARELQNYMEIGSHSMYHSILAKETAQAQYEDLRDSRQQLVNELDADIQVLAYPNGTQIDYNSDTLAAAEQAGYGYALTTEFGWNTRSTPRYEIRRWEMNAQRSVLDFTKILRDLAWPPRARAKLAG